MVVHMWQYMIDINFFIWQYIHMTVHRRHYVYVHCSVPQNDDTHVMVFTLQCTCDSTYGTVFVLPCSASLIASHDMSMHTLHYMHGDAFMVGMPHRCIAILIPCKVDCGGAHVHT